MNVLEGLNFVCEYCTFNFKVAKFKGLKLIYKSVSKLVEPVLVVTVNGNLFITLRNQNYRSIAIKHISFIFNSELQNKY